jgi:hypothetical protein
MNSPLLPQPAGQTIDAREVSERRDPISREPEEASP